MFNYTVRVDASVESIDITGICNTPGTTVTNVFALPLSLDDYTETVIQVNHQNGNSQNYRVTVLRGNIPPTSFTWDIDNAEQTVRLQIDALEGKRCLIDWGDGMQNEIIGRGAFPFPGQDVFHTYQASGTYQVTISGDEETCPLFDFIWNDLWGAEEDYRITSMDLRKATSLVRLITRYTELDDLDVSNCKELIALNILNNGRLTSLDITRNTELTYLIVSDNKLTHLDVSNNIHLEQLLIERNFLSEIDVSNNKNLFQFYIESNPLQNLDVTNNKKIAYLNIRNCQLTYLDISQNTALIHLYANANQFTELDVSHNTMLTFLELGGSPLKNLDVSNNTMLEQLYSGSTQLTHLDVSNLTALSFLECQGSQLEHLLINNCISLKSLYCFTNRLANLDISNNPALTTLSCSNNAIPLNNLYTLAQQTNYVENKNLGWQFLPDITVSVKASIAIDPVFHGIYTNFEVYGGVSVIDYTLIDGNITFLTKGTFTVNIRNPAILDGVVSQKFTVISDGSDSDDAVLKSLTTSSDNLTPAFSANETEYTVNVPSNINTITIYVETNHSGATVSGEITNVPLNVGENLITITVTAEDMVTTKIYTVTVIRAASNDATLKSLTVIDGNLSSNFVPGIMNYAVNVPNSVTRITIEAEANHEKATIIGNITNVPLEVGMNSIVITVTAEDGVTEETYIIEVFRAASNDATLKSLTISNGELSPAFDVEKTEYTVYVANSVTSITIEGEARHENTTVEVNVTNELLVVGENLITITVTAEDMVTTKIYTVTVIRAASNDATLKSISVSSSSLAPAFTSNVLAYTVNVENSVTSITVTGTANHEKATVAGSVTNHALDVGSNQVIITVTAENGTTKQNYTVTVVRAASNDATLQSIMVSSGLLSPAFTSNVLAYTVNVANSVTSITITGTTNHEKATVEGNVANYSLNVGSNLVTITVTAENGTTKQNYTVTVVRDASDDATLKDITVSSGTLTPIFSAGTMNYSVNVPNDVTAITITGEATHANAKVTGNATNKALVVGSNTVTITVTAENDVATKTYTITVVRAASGNVFLSSLTVSNGELSPAFNANETVYTVNVANNITSITITGEPSNTNATVNGNVSGKSLNVGANTVVITVTAEDGITVRTYTVTVIRAASDDATLRSLSTSSGVLFPAFSSGVMNYSLNVPNSVTNISVTGEANHAGATVSGNAIGKSLIVGNNSISIIVTAENGTTTRTYTINIVRAASDDATLKNLTVNNGTLSPAFVSSITNYTINVLNSVTSISVTGEANHVNASVSGNEINKVLIVGNNSVTITVTAEDGTTTQTYTILVVRAAPVASNDATLKSLTVSSGALSPSFAAGTTGYSVNVPNSVATITVTGEANHAGATVLGNETGKALNVGNNTVIITVTAEDGTTTQTYTITVVRAAPVASNDATLKNITLSSGALSPSFAAGTTGYTVNVPNNVTTITVIGEANHSGATVLGNETGKALIVGNNTVIITVTAEDGTTTKTYTITVVRAAPAASNDATLKSLTVSSGALSPSFAASLTGYTVNVPNSVTTITVTGEANHAGATVLGNEAGKALIVGNNTVIITVTAEDGTTTQTYTVTVVRAAPVASNDATLKSLTVSSGALTPAFAASLTSYTVNVPNSVTAITVTGEANHAGATVSGNETGKALIVGNNTVIITVTAEDGTTTQTYTITVVRAAPVASNDATLKSLTVSSGALTPAFAATVKEYTVSVPNNVTNITISGETNHAGATLTGVGTKQLNVGVNTFYIVVTAQDGISTVTYTLAITRQEPVNGTGSVNGSVAGAPTGTKVELYTVSQAKSGIPEGYQLVGFTLTDKNGNYLFSNLPEGVYIVLVVMDGYNTQPSEPLTLTGGVTGKTANFTVNNVTRSITPVGLTGTEDIFAPDLRIYPNPFTGEVHITGAVETWRAASLQLRVINAAGAIVHTQMIVSPDETIRLEHLPAGVYFFRVENGTQSKTIKVVKI